MSTTRTNDPTGVLLSLQDLRGLDGGTLVRIVEPGGSPNPRYWRSNYNGYTSVIAEAGQFPVNRMIDEGFTGVMYELVSTLPPPERPADKPAFIGISFLQAQSHQEKIGAKMCRVVVHDFHNSANGMYWRKPLPNGCTWNLDGAAEMRISTVLKEYDHVRDNILIEMVDQEMAAEIAKLPFKKCNMESCISTTLIEALVLHPEHPTYRAMLMARFKAMPPDTLKTYEEIRDWIEYNCDPPPQPIPATPSRRRAAPPPPEPPDRRFEIPLSFEQTELGDCRYSVPQTGAGNCRFTEYDIRSYCSDSISVEEVLSFIQSELDETAWDCSPEMEDDGDYEYDQHNHQDSTDHVWHYRQSNADRRTALINYLRTISDPEEQARLRINEPTTQTPTPPDMADIVIGAITDEPIF